MTGSVSCRPRRARRSRSPRIQAGGLRTVSVPSSQPGGLKRPSVKGFSAATRLFPRDGPRGSVGRSVARFFLAGQAAAGVLSVANAYGPSVGMRADASSANHVTLVKGSIWVTGKRVLTVGAWDAQGGANVQVEAYVEGLTEL